MVTPDFCFGTGGSFAELSNSAALPRVHAEERNSVVSSRQESSGGRYVAAIGKPSAETRSPAAAAAAPAAAAAADAFGISGLGGSFAFDASPEGGEIHAVTDGRAPYSDSIGWSISRFML